MNSDEIIFLLGAGASCDAMLKSSDAMTIEVEKMLDGKWSEYKQLYHAVKAAILYGHALQGDIRERVNIEEFVNVLTELARCKEHTIYPFIASWNMELLENAGRDFEKIRQFRKAIVKELVEKWVNLNDATSASYYKGLMRLAETLGSNLRVFSLNYDLCVESACGRDNVFTGFVHEENTRGRFWNDRLMIQDDNVSRPIRLYKLHGSVDWRLDNDRLVSYDSPDTCDNPDDYQLIFGTENKLRYTEPYLFLLSEFRKFSFGAKLIVCIGYSFQDKHINSIIQHAFSNQTPTKVVHVTKLESEGGSLEEIRKISARLKVKEDDVKVLTSGAKDFMDHLSIYQIKTLMPEKQSPF